MDLIEKTIQVPKETSEFADGITQVAVDTKTALDDGLQTVEDITAVAASAFKNMIGKAINDMSKMPGEAKENGYKFAMAWGVAGEKFWDALTKKAE